MSAKARVFTGLAVFALATSAVLFPPGCGGDDEESSKPKKDATTDNGNDGSGGAGGSGGTGVGGTGGAANCKLAGVSCATNGDCCSANCDPTTHVCVNPVGTCKTGGESCTSPTECCGLVCSGGVCGQTLCTSDQQPCTSDAQCCSGSCGDVGCLPLNPSCKTAGNSCGSNAECCSKLCQNGNCAAQPSFCTQQGDLCGADAECCTGICSKQTGATVGICALPNAPGTTGCLVAGQVCGAGANGDGGVTTNDAGIPACGGECCSRACAPYGPTGVLVCQPPSGCRPTGEICKDDKDCCGAEGVPGGNGSVKCSKSAGEPVGRCDNGNACRPAGAVCKLATTSCNAENNCCAGNVNQKPEVCQQDLLGIPRCTGVGNCADAGSQVGKACASSADCCGLPCLPNSDPNGSPFICGASCVPSGGTCTTDADCCTGLPCKAPPGSTKGVCGPVNIPDAGTDSGADSGTDAGTDSGTCALYGQSCTTGADCCNKVPCTSGKCVYPIQ